MGRKIFTDLLTHPATAQQNQRQKKHNPKVEPPHNNSTILIVKFITYCNSSNSIFLAILFRPNSLEITFYTK